MYFLIRGFQNIKKGAERKILPQLQNRTVTSDERMISDLANMLLGVVYQFIGISKFPLYGITRWVNGSIPLIQPNRPS